MTDPPYTHWTTDEHLLAQYVLGQLDEQQTSELEKHLRDCAQCRDAVMAEQQIAAGLRRAGREALKQHLAERLAQKRPVTKWYRVAGVAATFILILTVGIYSNWFFSGKTQLAETQLKSDSIAPKAGATPRQTAPEQQSHGKMQLTDVSKPSASDRDRVESKGAGTRVAELDKKIADRRGEQREALNVPSPAESANNLIKKDEMMAPAQEAGGIWVQGTVLAGEANVRAIGQAMEKSAQDFSGNVQMGKKEPAALMSLTARSRPLAAEGPPVIVTQRPVSDLPRRQFARSQKMSHVQTLFRSDASGLLMYLYSDSLLSQDDLRRARLQTVSDDSVVLQIGQQRIGYRLLPGLIEQLSRQRKRAP